jgi:hypothetical protein
MQICTATNVIWIDVYINIGPIVRMVCPFELLWSKASNRLQWEQNLQNALFSVRLVFIATLLRQAALRRKSKDLLARNYDNVSD